MQKQSTKTLYDYWNSLRGSRSAPDRRDIDPTKIRGALAKTVLLDLNESREFDFRLAGAHLCAASARELNTVLHSAFAEDQIFRIDHFLGKETVQNLLVFRFANGLLQPSGDIRPEPLMDVEHVAQAVVFMADLPLESNVQFLTIMATKMPFVGRG